MLLLFCTSLVAMSIGVSEKLAPMPGKSLVYFIRPSSTAFAIKFKIYDNEILIGKLSHRNYIVYECDPGEHVFVIRGENIDYLDANLEPNKVYLVECEVKPGIVQARVSFEPISPTHKKFEKKKKSILKLIGNAKKGKEAEQDENEVDFEEPSSIMKKFNERKEKGKKIKQLTPEMAVEIAHTDPQ